MEFSKTSAVDNSLKELQRLRYMSMAIAREREHDIKDLEHKRIDIINTILTLKQKIITKVDKLVDRATSDVERLHTIGATEISSHLVSLRQMSDDIENKITTIEKQKKQGDELKLFVAVHDAMNRHGKLIQSIRQIHADAHKVFLKFEINPRIELTIDTLHSVGELKLETIEYSVIPKSKQVREKLKPSICLLNFKIPEVEEHKIRKRVSDRNTKRTEDIFVKDKEDLKTCWVTGICVLKDSTIILADNNNDKIKLIGSNHKILNTINLSTPPFDIALLNQTEAAFTLPDRKQVQFISVIGRSDIEYGAVLQLDFDCNGISVLKENLILRSIVNKSVTMVNLDGVVIWSVEQKLFWWPWYVDICGDLGKIYVSDRRKNTVTTLNTEGNVLNVRDVSEKGLRGLTFDDLGNMYMCHYMTDEIEIQNLNYPRDRRVLLGKTDGINHPQSIVYDSNNGHIILSFNNFDYLKTFQLT